MNLQKMPEWQRLELRKKCLRSLYAFCIAVMGYDDITDMLHGEYCRFLGQPAARKQVTMPRSFVKTWIGSIAYPVWVTLIRKDEDDFPYLKAWEDKYWQLGPNMRILIASYVISNSEKMIGLIRKTYESNTAMQILFPEVIPPNFHKIKWNNQSACILRPDNFTESTFEAAGIGGASVSRHYDLIQEDDLIYAKKDDLTGQELQPSQDDIDQSIGWHKLVHSLLVPGKHTHIHNAGTRWAKHDLIDYIWTKEPSYARFIKGAVNLDQLKKTSDWKTCDPEWPEAYDIAQLKRIEDAQGPFMFSTQYLLQPRSPDETLLKDSWLQRYISPEEVPKTIRKFTTVDLAGWGTIKRSRQSRAVILTCGWDENNHVWLLHYDVGRYSPSEVIDIMARHWKIFKPEAIYVEEVYYQKALAHFAHKAMERGDVPDMTIRAVKPEGNQSKELRIRSIEPIASRLAVHCKPVHKDFIDEWIDYVPNNDTCKKDILDAMAYQIQVARPGEPTDADKRKDRNDFVSVGNMDDFLKKCWERANPKGIFGNRGVILHPYHNTGEDELDLTSNITDPFSDDIIDL